MAELQLNNDSSTPSPDALLPRPSGAAPPTSMDQLAGYTSYYGAASSGDGFDLREILRKVRKRRYLIATIVLIVTTVVTIDSFRNVSYYQATAKIALTQEEGNLRLGELVIGGSINERINTDLLMIKTYPLLEDVVVMLRLDQNPRFLPEGRKSIRESIEMIFAKLRSRASPEKMELPTLAPLVLNGEATDQRTPVEKARLAPYVQVLMASLSVSQVPMTRAIDVTFTHTDPEIASNVANGVAQVFIDYSYRNKTESVTTSANWLDRTTRSLLAQVQQAEENLSKYSISHNIFGSSESLNLTGEKLASVYGQALKAETDRILKQSIYEEVRKGRVAQLPEAFSDSRTQQLQSDLNNLQIKLAELNARYGPENPRVAETRQQITEIQTLINDGTRFLEERLRADYERALRDETLIKEALGRAKAEVIQQNQDAIQFNILRQNVETAKGLYNDFLQKTNQVNLQRADQAKDMRVIDPAQTPGAPVGPNRLRSILLGLLLSLLGGVGLALGIEYLDNTIKSIEDVQRVTQLPTLAVIPTMNQSALRAGKQKRKAITGDTNQRAQGRAVGKGLAGIVPRGLQPKAGRLATLDGLSVVVEAYRMLRTAVLLSTAGKPPKTIQFTSSQPGEGKTTTAINMAISMAQLGARVLLIDADLRRPTVHKTFKLPQMRGLSSFLSSNGEIDEFIIKLPSSNLSVMTAGPIPPNPAELIGSDRMRELLRQLGEQFDHVIIDSPPLVSVTDPVVLSTLVDGTILVVQAGRTTKDLIRRARLELGGVGAKIFGVVLNNVNIRREGYDEYYYHRYYSNYYSRKES